MLSNGAALNVVYHDLDPHFQGNEFLNMNISQTAIDSRIIRTDLQPRVEGTIQFYHFSPKYCFPIHLFQMEWKTRLVNFLENYSINSRIFCGLRSRYSWSIKKCATQMAVAAQFSLYFPGGKCVNWKNSENIENLRHHLTDFHQVFTKNDRTVVCLSIYCNWWP